MKSIREKGSLRDSRLLYIRSNIDYSYNSNINSVSSSSRSSASSSSPIDTSSNDTSNVNNNSSTADRFTSAGSNSYEILNAAKSNTPIYTEEEKNNVWQETYNAFMMEHNSPDTNPSMPTDLSNMNHDQRMTTLQQMRMEADQQRFARYEQDLEEAKKRDAEKAAKENQSQTAQQGNNTMGVILQAVQGIIGGAFA